MTINTTFKADTSLLWFGNTLVSIPASFEDGADQISVIEIWAPFGDSPPMHLHHSQDEVFIVLKGQLRLVLDGRDIILNAGGSAVAPKGVAHTFRVESAEGAQFFAITRGKDFETMIRKAGRAAERNELPPMTAPSQEMIAQLTALCAESRIEFVGPPLQ